MALNNSDLQAIKSIVHEEIEPLRHDMTVMKKGIKRIEKKLDKSVDFLDRQDIALGKRVGRIEAHIGLSSPSL